MALSVVAFSSLADAFFQCGVYSALSDLSVASVIQASLVAFLGSLVIYKVSVAWKPRLKLPPG
eukprot:c55864_g1_i1 orf=1-186(-)